MINKIWLNPPLAFARIGTSPSPCDSFMWGPNDIRPRGTGKTTIYPDITLSISEDGTVSSTTPTNILFKDSNGFKPVCPFFELHGEWHEEEKTKSGPITPKILLQFGLDLEDLDWKVSVANLKAYHYTLNESDKILADVNIKGNDTRLHTLLGQSPKDSPNPLIPDGKNIHLGDIQLTKPNDEFPEIRFRFYPPTGKVYGPVDLAQRSELFKLPIECMILNSDAVWCHFTPKNNDYRTNPSGLYATDQDGKSLGLVDDVCDGIISCVLPDVKPAFARIVVAPPDYAPDRRPFTSIADGLADRVKRHEVIDPTYVEDMNVTTMEVRDLMERVLETMELMNLDAQNDRARTENRAIAQNEGLEPDAGADKSFPRMDSIDGLPLPLTEMGRQQHRRFISLEVFEDILRERPDVIDTRIRKPMTGDKYYDRNMPAVMRGSDRYPMHLTRRQYDLLVSWSQRLRKDVEGGS